MACPDCGSPVVAFGVPADLEEYAPSDRMTLCTHCLRTATAEAAGGDDVSATDDANFDAVHDALPSGRAGVAVALAIGKLGSLALERRAIESLVEEAERAGADVWLTLDRLGHADGLDPYVDLARRTEQLQSF